MYLANAWTVFRFEWRRAMTFAGIAWWLVLAIFPVAMVFAIHLVPGDVPREPWSVFLFVLIPMLVSMLGTFLWTTPAVSAELEQQSWTYLAVRPGGRTALLLGKYLAAVLWVMPAILAGLAGSVLIAASELTVEESKRIAFALVAIASLSCPAYAAVYLLLGTIFTKRSMAIAVVYTLIFELAISLVPAVINKFTVQFRLRALLIQWANIDVNQADEIVSSELIGTAPAWHHVTILILYTISLVAAAVWVVRRREYAALGDA